MVTDAGRNADWGWYAGTPLRIDAIGFSLALCGAPSACYQASGLDEFYVGDDESTCGDGVVAGGEDCEDGNGAAGDGCTDCRYDCRGPGEIADPSSGRCYRRVPAPLAWAEAQRQCAALGAGFHLAVLAALAERDLVMPLVTTSTWIGASDDATEGVFQWINGEPFTYVNGVPPWSPGEPNNGAGLGDEDCVELAPVAVINDLPCDSVLPYLCERP